MVAAPWIPDASLADADGTVRPEIVWSVLDCPSWFGMSTCERFEGSAMFRRMVAAVRVRPCVGDRCVVIGCLLASEDRKVHCGSALLSDASEVIARARTTWIKFVRKN